MLQYDRIPQSVAYLPSNSSDKEQQAHPFCNWTIPSALLLPDTSLLSILTDATSLTITAILIPFLFSSKFFRSVVFPDPRKPDITVMGMGLLLMKLEGVENA